MDILYGTGNPAKLSNMRSKIHGLPIRLLSLQDFAPVRQAPEDGETPLENARQKARLYWDTFHFPCFSCDSGLYLKGIPDALQPGVHARRVQGKHLNDEEMIAYYAALARQYGRIEATYQNGICLILDNTHCYELQDDTLHGAPFYIVDTPHPKRIHGFPLDSISTDASGAYYFDMHKKVDDPAENQGFPLFFKKALEDYFQKSIKEIEDHDSF